MSYHKYLVVLSFIAITTFGHAQSRIFIETFGANSLLAGALGYEQLIPLSDKQTLGINAGLGLRHSGTNGPNFWIYKGGLNMYHNGWGIGVDAAFHNRLEKANFNTYSEIRTIIYPNLSYTWDLWEKWHLRSSIGYSFHYHKVVNAWFRPGPDRGAYWEDSRWPTLGLVFGVQL